MNVISQRLQKFLTYKELQVPDFAVLLGYASPEKLYRLFRDEDAMPSAQIIIDVTNKFDEFNIKWWLTGAGQMLNKTGNTPPANASNSIDRSLFDAVALRLKGHSVTESVTNPVTNQGKKRKKPYTYPIGEDSQSGLVLNEPTAEYDSGKKTAGKMSDKARIAQLEGILSTIKDVLNASDL